MKRFGLILAVVTALALAVSPAQAKGGGDGRFQEQWQGLWSTSGIHGTIKLIQDGRAVVGKYINEDGKKIKGVSLGGTVKEGGIRLVGEYDCDGKDSFDISLIENGDGFKGEYDPKGMFSSAEKWRGSRQ